MNKSVVHLFVGLLFWGMTGPGFSSVWAAQSDVQSMQGAWASTPISTPNVTPYYYHNGNGGSQPGGYHHSSGNGPSNGYCW